MSNRCKVESCSKWVFEGGLCRGHMPVPQASGHVAVTAATSLFPKQPALPPHPPVLTLPGVERISGAKGGLTAPGTLQSIVARMMQHLRECSLRNDHRPTGSPFCVFVGARDDALPPANKNTYIWSCSWSCTCAGAFSIFLQSRSHPSRIAHLSLNPQTPNITRDCLCTGGWECSNCKSSWPYTRSQCHGAKFSLAVTPYCFKFALLLPLAAL
jgi:hypothetical protein